MGKLSTAVAAGFALLLSWCGPASAQHRAEPGAFDYYVLSLSWSPSHCARAKDEADPEQCGVDRRFGFIVHGLWPQYRDGGYPANCSRERSVPREVVEQTLPVMPSAGLIRHQWRKHGTCSGLAAADYFARLRAAYARVTMPEALKVPGDGLSVPAGEVERLFIRANPGLEPESIAVICSKRAVTEVRLCLDKDLAFMPCGAKVVDRCRRDATLAAAP